MDDANDSVETGRTTSVFDTNWSVLYIFSISNNKNIQKTNSIVWFFFYCKLYFVIITLKNIFDCGNFITRYRCYNVVHVSKIKRGLKRERGFTVYSQVLHNNVSGDRRKGRTHRKTGFLFIRDVLEVKSGIRWADSEAIFKSVPWHFYMRLDLRPSVSDAFNGYTNLNILFVNNTVVY